MSNKKPLHPSGKAQKPDAIPNKNHSEEPDIGRLWDALTDDMLALTDEEFIAELIEDGEDLDELAAQMAVIRDRAIKLYDEVVALRAKQGDSVVVKVNKDDPNPLTSEWRTRTEAERVKRDNMPPDKGR